MGISERLFSFVQTIARLVQTIQIKKNACIKDQTGIKWQSKTLSEVLKGVKI